MTLSCNKTSIFLYLVLITCSCASQRYDYYYDPKPKCDDINYIIKTIKEKLGTKQNYNLCYDPEFRFLGMRPLRAFLRNIEGVKIDSKNIYDNGSIQFGAGKCVGSEITIIEKDEYYENTIGGCDLFIAISDIVIDKNNKKWASVELVNCAKFEILHYYINYDLNNIDNGIKIIEVVVDDYPFSECKSIEK